MTSYEIFILAQEKNRKVIEISYESECGRKVPKPPVNSEKEPVKGRRVPPPPPKPPKSPSVPETDK